jgi:7-keto-8-aminopelargonate synthetase-like enzyme
MYDFPEYALKANNVFKNLDWKQSGQLKVSDINKNNSNITIDGNEITSFGSSSYLGLHKDSRIIEAGIDTMRQFGVVYSSSRSYTYLDLHNELESEMEKIFGNPVLATIQTTMAHFPAMQLLMLPSHGAIIDMQAHATLQNMILLPKAQGMKTETILHNDLNMLESKIQRLQKHCRKIWFVADGIYSMYGDGAPVRDLLQLLAKYENLYLYFDDAHGMSWCGHNGSGYVWNELKKGHERIVVTTSLGKGFGLGGGAIICPNSEVKKMLLHAGGSFVFCTQLPVQMLGSGIASAKIHTSAEIYSYQQKLQSNILFFIKISKFYQLPVIDYSRTPIFFMACGNQQLGLTLCERLIKQKFYVNVGIYPAVGPKNTGLRISLTSLHTHDEIENLIKAIHYELHLLLAEYKLEMADLLLAFKI